MKIDHKKVAEHLGVRLRGNETFDELLKIEQQVKEYNERKERIAEENANIQRVDAQVKKCSSTHDTFPAAPDVLRLCRENFKCVTCRLLCRRAERWGGHALHAHCTDAREKSN